MTYDNMLDGLQKKMQNIGMRHGARMPIERWIKDHGMSAELRSLHPRFQREIQQKLMAAYERGRKDQRKRSKP